MQAAGKGRQQLLTSWIRPKMPSIVQSGTGDKGGQRLLTSWMRPKSSSAPTVSSAPVPAMEYTSPAPEVCAATVPVVESISPAPAASFSETIPVIEYTSPAPAGYASPAALMEHVGLAPAVNIADPAMFSAQETVVEYISPATTTSFAAPTPVQYATPVKHAAPEQYDAPMVTVIGVDLNRDGISDVLQQPQMSIRRLSNSEHKTPGLFQELTRFCPRMERWFGRCLFFFEVYFAVSLPLVFAVCLRLHALNS